MLGAAGAMPVPRRRLLLSHSSGFIGSLDDNSLAPLALLAALVLSCPTTSSPIASSHRCPAMPNTGEPCFIELIAPPHFSFWEHEGAADCYYYLVYRGRKIAIYVDKDAATFQTENWSDGYQKRFKNILGVDGALQAWADYCCENHDHPAGSGGYEVIGLTQRFVTRRDVFDAAMAMGLIRSIGRA
ncbi:hypothetical protein FB451DRAFT_1394157 [Mycena latifolia]|nr:hypothetical protein FB451DRAFT_1394157 [Mycena latifolia]